MSRHYIQAGLEGGLSGEWWFVVKLQRRKLSRNEVATALRKKTREYEFTGK